MSPPPPATVVLYRSAPSTTLLTTLAAAAEPGGVLYAHGPVLHGPDGAEAAATIEAVSRSHECHALVWDGDAPFDTAGVAQLVSEVSAEMLVVEWDPDGGDDHIRLAGSLLAQPPCDILLVRAGELAAIQEVVVAAGEGPNAPMVASLVHRWATAFGVPAAVLRAISDEEDRAHAEQLCNEMAPGMRTDHPVGGDLLDILAGVARRCGFLALGAAEGVSAKQLGVRTLGGRLARLAGGTIVVGRTAPDHDQSAWDLRRSSSSDTSTRRSTLPTIVSGSSERNS